jgi:phosphoribosyl 1,2-cyclic phosphodiesterase
MERGQDEMKLWVLGSGSRGNAVVVESGECRVLIDAGFGPRILQKRMRSVGLRPESIEACIITHEHSDHVRGAVRCARRWNWPLWATEGTVEHSRRLRSADRAVGTFRAGATLAFTELELQTFATPHDAAEPIGIVLTARVTGARAAVCTDIGYASDNVREIVRDVDIMVLESNHDEQMLWNGPYPPWLRARIASNTGHLSNRACAQLVRESVTRRLRQIVLAHLSEKNNTPKVAYENMRSGVQGTGFRGALMPAMQDGVVGPFVPLGTKTREQLSLAL